MIKEWISELSDISPDINRWGNKCINLYRILKYNINIPYTYCLSTMFFDFYKQHHKLCNEEMLEICFNNLLNHSKTKKIIIRSSATLEDTPNNSFAGIFSSVGNVDNFATFIDGIIHCYNSLDDEKTKYYSLFHNINERTIKMALIVQEHISPDISGVFFSENPYRINNNSIVELCLGFSIDMLQGRDLGNTYEIFETGKYKIITEHIKINEKILLDIFCHLSKTVKEIGVEFNASDIEWLWDGNKLCILQIRPAMRKSIFYEDNKSIFNKLNAMKYFVKHGFFNKKTFFIEEDTLEKTISALKKIKFNTNVKVMRFAKDGALGLPKVFVTSLDDAIRGINDSWIDGASIIIYDEINIKDSFEVFVKNELLIMEHIPGVWDSYNKLMPDIVYTEHGKKILYKYNDYRAAVYDTYGKISYNETAPMELKDILEIFTYVMISVVKLKKDINKESFYWRFVCDVNNEMFSLNIRNIKGFDLSFKNPEAIKIINSVDEIMDLSVDRPVLLDFPIDRGNEISLLKYAFYFKNRVCYIKFGILSHIAIVLREMGSLTLPYIDYDRYTKINLEEI